MWYIVSQHITPPPSVVIKSPPPYVVHYIITSIGSSPFSPPCLTTPPAAPNLQFAEWLFNANASFALPSLGDFSTEMALPCKTGEEGPLSYLHICTSPHTHTHTHSVCKCRPGDRLWYPLGGAVHFKLHGPLQGG